jgi:hypothetical protein
MPTFDQEHATLETPIDYHVNEKNKVSNLDLATINTLIVIFKTSSGGWGE